MPAMLSPILSLKALATSPMLKFMPLSVASVIFCTSSAWMVALSAAAFWSSQNWTAFNSCTRFSSSSTLSVGAIQLARLGNCGMACAVLPACLVRFCKKSKPGTNLPKSGKDGMFALLMGDVSWRVVQYCIGRNGLWQPFYVGAKGTKASCARLQLCSVTAARQPVFLPGSGRCFLTIRSAIPSRSRACARLKRSTRLERRGAFIRAK